MAFVVTTIDSEEDLYRRTIWIHDGSGARPFTSGDGDTAPRWSPAGTHLCFLRKADNHSQVAVIPIDGGEASVVTDFPLGVTEAEWSPDGSALAVVGAVWSDEWADLDDEERRRRPRRIRRRDYRADGSGWTHDRHRFIHLVDPCGVQETRRLTDGERDEAKPTWAPDGATIAFLSDVSSNPGYEPGTGIWVASTGGGAAEPAGPRGMWYALAYRPDGVLHAVGYPGDEFPDLQLLWRLGPDAECVSPDHPRALFPLGAGADRFFFVDGSALVPQVDRGSVGLVSIDPEGATREVAGGSSAVTGFDRSGDVLVTTVSSVEHPGRLIVTGGDSPGTVENFGGRQLPTVTPDHFTVDGPGAELDVWVYLPPGEEEVPLLLNIHGGPASQYGWAFFDEFQVYTQAGYGVVATNPRGSGGADRDFLRAVTGKGWGEVDVEDIDAVVDAALQRHPRLSRDRMGVMGGSYGGFLTAWLIAHQDRWRAAVVERALLSWPSFGGTSDIGGWFGDRYLGEPELMWDRSPLRLVSRVTTPTLIIHSEDDFRCPIEQAEQYFDGLLRAGVEAEFVRFPGEGHEMSRGGSPRHREERFEIILEWLAGRL